MRGWIFEDNVWPFLEILAGLAKYDYDWWDRDAIDAGLAETDADAGNWFEYRFEGAFPLRFEIANDRGSTVVALRIDAPDDLAPRIEMAISIAQEFYLESMNPWRRE
jgi:hypothetical protein